jgi:hypothetical protein
MEGTDGQSARHRLIDAAELARRNVSVIGENKQN